MNATWRQIKFSDEDVVNSGNFIPRGEYNPHNVRPWLLHDQGFCLCVVFAHTLQDALDEAVDEGKLDRFQLVPTDKYVQQDYMHEVEHGRGFKMEKEDGSVVYLDWNDSVTFLGNASEPFDIESLGAEELPNPPFSFCALFNAMEKNEN
jgi:hypothetical protein